MVHQVGTNYAAINTGWGLKTKMVRGGESVCPYLPSSMATREKIRVTRGRGVPAKGSVEAKARMAYLRSLRGKGCRGKGVCGKGIRGKGWDDSYTDAALRGGDLIDSYTMAALLGGDDFGLTELFDEGSSNMGTVKGIFGAIVPAVKDSLLKYAENSGREALAYVQDPNNMKSLISKVAPKVVGALKKLWGKLTGKSKVDEDELMKLLRHLKKNDPVAYEAKINEIRSGK